MHPDPARQWLQLGIWIVAASSLPLFALLAYVLILRQWVRSFGSPATATILQAARVAHLPHIVTQVTLSLTPPNEPGVRIRARMRWSEHLIDPQLLIAGARLPVRYRLGRQTIVMPIMQRQ